jgi:hypothetical protein
MKIYSVEEAKNVHSIGRGRHTLVHAYLLQLKPGEKLEIIKGTDWISKTKPHRLVKRFADKHQMQLKVGRNLAGTGWIVERLK